MLGKDLIAVVMACVSGMFLIVLGKLLLMFCLLVSARFYLLKKSAKSAKSAKPENCHISQDSDFF